MTMERLPHAHIPGVPLCAGSAVHSPGHYTDGGIEAIDYIRAKLGKEGFRAYCLGNVLKYVSRWDKKDGEQDLNKALVYLQWAIAKEPNR
jgi:hypothetical protein